MPGQRKSGGTDHCQCAREREATCIKYLKNKTSSTNNTDRGKQISSIVRKIKQKRYNKTIIYVAY